MIRSELEDLLASAGRAPAAPADVTIVGSDPVLPGRFRVGEAAAAAIAACGVMVSDLWELRTGRRQRVRVDVRAAAASLLGFALQRLEGRVIPRPSAVNPTVALYPTRDGRWIHLHGGFPRLEAGTLALLGCARERAAIAAAVARWDAGDLEEALAESGQCGAMVRSAEEWAAHPQGRAISGAPVVEITRIGDSEPESLRLGDRPLAGVRVLDLTRVLAGPTCARTLAEHGADVLKITSPHLPSIEPFSIDTGHGKRSAQLDLRRAADAGRLEELVRGADVFSQSYRSGALERLGFGAERLAALRPGIIYVALNCYGHAGPWRERPGWEQLAQAVTGIAAENGEPGRPRLLPAAACDYTAGYLAAFGALVALARRVRGGGSHRVRVSLAQSGSWLVRQGTLAAAERGRRLDAAEVEARLISTRTPRGLLRHLPPVVEMSETPARWDRPPVPLGTHEAAWVQL